MLAAIPESAPTNPPTNRLLAESGLWLDPARPLTRQISRVRWEETELGPIQAWPPELRAAVQLMADGGAVMAILWGPEFRLLYNERYGELLQDKHPAAFGRRAVEVFPEIWSSIEPRFQQALIGVAVVDEDLELQLARNGETKAAYFSFSYNPIRRADGCVGGFLAVVIETTGRVAREQERAHVFDTVLSSITDFTYTFDATGRFVYVNKALLDLWGLKLGDAVGKNFFDLNYPDDLAGRLQHQIQQVFTEKRRVCDETRYVSPTGVDAFYEYIFSPVFGADGSVILVAGSTRDITARKKLESDALAAAHAKDDFLAALSHELRTPLTPALLTATELREDKRLPAEIQEKLGLIERNIALEARLIDDLLDLTAIVRGKLHLVRQPCDAHALIELAVEIVRPEAAAKQTTIKCEFGARHTELNAEPTRIQQVVWNLLRNAVKFAPRGGRVTVRTTERTDADATTWLCLEVADNGVGIAAEDLERIFNPFDQGTRDSAHRFGGLGLGLSIARAVVEQHGGRITAASDGLGHGARFLVELPGARALTSGSAPPHGTAMAANRVPPLRLLLVEDHVNTLQALLGLLRREGHFVIGASDIASARAAAARERFDLVISDLGLPDGSGVELMRALRAEHGLRGIALSGYGMEEDVKRSLAAGFVTHLTKPVVISEVRRVLEAFRSLSA